jgi:hypothetical protein
VFSTVWRVYPTKKQGFDHLVSILGSSIFNLKNWINFIPFADPVAIHRAFQNDPATCLYVDSGMGVGQFLNLTVLLKTSVVEFNQKWDLVGSFTNRRRISRPSPCSKILFNVGTSPENNALKRVNCVALPAPQ